MDESGTWFKKRNQVYKWTGAVIAGVLFIAFLFKITLVPNRLLVILGGIILFTILYIPFFLFINLKDFSNRISIWVHIAGLFSCFLLFWIFFVWFVFPIIHAQFHVVPLTKFQLFSALSVTAIGTLGYFTLMYVRSDDRLLWQDRMYFAAVSLVCLLCIGMNFPLIVQAPDRFYSPEIRDPVYKKGEGPLILVDHGHNNFHTLNDRLISTGRILRKDGYQVLPHPDRIENEDLEMCRILMIVNALHKDNRFNWSNPVLPAFSHDEIVTIRNWVKDGGSLFLVADHMPFPGAVANLASEFGFVLLNGNANDTLGLPDYFIRSHETLANAVITNGRHKLEAVDSILTFGGHAFKVPETATSFMTFDGLYFQWEPEYSWEFDGIRPYPVEGYSQGACREFGKGRIVILGEAMMITAQLGGGLSMIRIGMNSRAAPDNYQLLLNIIHWLDRKI